MTKKASDAQCDRALELFEELERKPGFKKWPAYDEVAALLLAENWGEDGPSSAGDTRDPRDSHTIERMIERARQRRRKRLEDSELQAALSSLRVRFVTPPLDRKGSWIWASQVSSELSDYTGRRAGSFEFAWAATSSRDIGIGTVAADRLFVQSLREGPASGTIVADLVALE